MSSDDIMGRYADVQHLVSGLLEGSRQMRDGTAPVELKLLEEGFFVIGHELLEIATDLRRHVQQALALEADADEYVRQAKAMLEAHERAAVANGLIPAILWERTARVRSLGDLGPNVVRIPDGLAREIWRMGRTAGAAK